MVIEEIDRLERLKTILILITTIILCLVAYTVTRTILEDKFTLDVFILRVAALYLVILMCFTSIKAISIKQNTLLK